MSSFQIFKNDFFSLSLNVSQGTACWNANKNVFCMNMDSSIPIRTGCQQFCLKVCVEINLCLYFGAGEASTL